MPRRADTFALGLPEITREVASVLYGDFAAERGDFADLFALFNTDALWRSTVIDILAAELSATTLRVYKVRHYPSDAADPPDRLHGRARRLRIRSTTRVP